MARPKGSLSGLYGPRRTGAEVLALNAFTDALRHCLGLDPIYSADPAHPEAHYRAQQRASQARYRQRQKEKRRHAA